MRPASIQRAAQAALFALLVAAVPPTATRGDEVLERIVAEQEKQRQLVRERLKRVRDLEANAPSGFFATVMGDSNPDYQRFRRELEREQANLLAAETALREAVVAEIVVRVRPMTDPQEISGYLAQRESEASATYSQRSSAARVSLAQGLRSAKSEPERTRAKAELDGLLRTARLEYESAAAATRQAFPVQDAVSATTKRMRELMRHATINMDVSDIRDPHAREAERWLREYQRDTAISEYRRLARTAPVHDPATGRPITGVLRQEIARDSERALANELRKRSLQPSRYDVLSFLAATDPRKTVAEGIESDVETTPEYRALDFLNPSATDKPSAYFRALAHAVRLQEQDVDKWRTDSVPDHKFTTGAGTAHKIAGTAGEMSLKSVDARIARYHRDADAVVSALEAAASKPPAQLAPEQYQLLRAYGYITGAKDSERYQVPTAQQLSGLKRNLNLPGAHVLDAISASNVTKTVIAAVAPTMAGGQMASLLRGLGAGERTAAAGVTVTDMLVGLGTDAAFELGETGKVENLGRKVIDATLMRAGGALLGSASNAAAGKLASTFDNKALRERAEKYLVESLGLAGETVLQSYYQGQVEGTGMTYNAFLSNLVSGSISRAAAGAYEEFDTANVAPKWIQKRIPEFLRPAVAADPAVAQELFDRQKALAARQTQAERKFAAVVGEELAAGPPPASAAGLNGTSSLASDGLRREQLANRLTHALESGQITWAELKALYAQRPDLEPVMATLNQRRTDIFSGMANKAQERARAELDAEYALNESQLRLNLKDDPQLGEALFRNQQAKARELDEINRRPLIPGSTNLTSDIDRSSSNERVRKHLKQLYASRTAGSDQPATSAQAWDVNEYINVLPAMGKILNASRDLADLPAGREYLGLKHGQAIEANGMASAMLHMTPAQRELFRANLRQKAAADPTTQALLQRQLNVADISLARADKELTDEMNALKKQNPNLADTTDLATRARDNLYQKRTEAIGAKTARVEMLEQQLRGLDAGTPDAQRLNQERNRLLGEIHRDWSYTLREGIETYASFENLDVVLGDAQFPDVKFRQLIDDPNYHRAALVANGRDVTDASVRNMLNDQVMMMTHHLNGYHEGREGVVDAGSALAKYAERSVLALKLQGVDLTQEPYRRLNEISGKLVKARKDPAALRKELEELGSGDADAGLMALSQMIMAAVPGTAGLFDPALSVGGEPSDLRGLRSDIAHRRQRAREQARTVALSGPATALAENAQRLVSIDTELEGLRGEAARRARLAPTYARQDWPKVETLEAEAARLDARQRVLEALDATGSPEYAELQRRRAEIAQKLADYATSFRAAGGPDSAKPSADDDRLAKRIAELEEEQRLREDLAVGLGKAMAEDHTRVARTAPFADGVTPFAENPPLDVKSGSEITASLLGAKAKLKVE